MKPASDIHPDAAHKRESREWWAVDTDGQRVVKVTGFSCAPNSPDSWWVPTLGYTMTERRHLFPTQAAALDQYIGELERLAVETGERIVALRLQRSRL